MAGEWEETSLAAIMDVKHGFAFSGEKIRDEPPGDILLTPGNFAIGGGFKGDKFKYFDGEVPVDYVLSEGDLVVTMTDLSKQADTLGYPALVPKPCGLRFLHNQRLGKVLIKNGADLDKGFLFYLLRTAEYRHEVLASATGTTVKHTSPARILAHKASIPPLAEQKAIAAVLGALDDKIELNRRMNAKLEEMARALFQSWFVDFDPVRAKLDGRRPFSLDPATAALFPEHLEDSQLGHIPKGWEVKAVGDIGDVICGKTPPTSVADYYGEDIPFITIPDMHGNVFCAATARKLSLAGANSQANKTLPPGSLCVSCIATPGLVVITSEDSQTNQQINSVVPYQKEETYFWYWVMTGLGAEIASSGSGGSVLVNLSKGRFETLQVIKPPHALISAYHTTVRPFFEAILANTHQSRSLAILRDTLLPKLLSGELKVPNLL